MSDLVIEGTSSSPLMKFKTDGKFEISGKSIPSNAHRLFEPVFNWLKDYNSEKTVFTFKLEYLNTSSSKILFDILLNVKEKSEDVLVQWFYEEGDDDVLDTGKHYESLLKLPFEFYVMSELEEMEG